MRGFGVLILIVGVLAALFLNMLIGAVLIVIGLLAIIAGGQTAKPTAICEKCGNPVARTANICPTCGTKLVPTEGPLAPPQDPAARRREGMIGLYAIIGAFILIVALVVYFSLAR